MKTPLLIQLSDHGLEVAGDRVEFGCFLYGIGLVNNWNFKAINPVTGRSWNLQKSSVQINYIPNPEDNTSDPVFIFYNNDDYLCALKYIEVCREDF